jgi:hypothetical protein
VTQRWIERMIERQWLGRQEEEIKEGVESQT